MPQPQRKNTNTNPASVPGFSFEGPSSLFDLVTGPWALTPEMLNELQAIYLAHTRGEKIDQHAIMAAIGSNGGGPRRDFEVVDGVAIISAQGAIAPKANLFTAICGGTSAQILQRQLAQALEDPRINAIVLDVDSPGGSVIGNPDFARAVYAGRGTKPIVSHTDGVMASAAYWFGSAADAVYMSGATNIVGSIGIVARHINTGAGDRVTEITAGKYKREASDLGPLTKEGRAHLQAQVDYFYSIFVNDVAQFRGVSVDQVLADMADGRTFIGQQAIDAGLVDGVSTLSDLIARLADDPQSVTQRTVKAKAPTKRTAPPNASDALPAPAAAAGAAATQEPPTEPVLLDPQSHATRTDMDKATLERDHTALYNELQATFRKEGATAELQRIKDVRAQSLPGHEALIERLAMDGTTTGPQAAAAIVAAEQAKNATQARAHADDAPNKAPAGGAPADAQKSDTEKAAEATALAKAEGISVIDALKKLGYAA